MLIADNVALTKQPAGQMCYWSRSMKEGGALHLLCLHSDKDTELARQAIRLSCSVFKPCICMKPHTPSCSINVLFWSRLFPDTNWHILTHRCKRLIILSRMYQENTWPLIECISPFLWGQYDHQFSVITLRMVLEHPHKRQLDKWTNRYLMCVRGERST